MNNAVLILFCFSSVLLTLNVHQVTAAYVNRNGCPSTTAGNVTCPGVGTSQTSDSLIRINNRSERYLLFQFSRLTNLWFVADVGINYQISLYGTLYITGIIAFIVFIRNAYLIVLLTGTTKIFTIQNNNNEIGGFDGLRGAGLLPALQLIQTPFPYQCNLVTPASELFAPQPGMAKASYVALDITGLQSVVAKTYGNSIVNIKQRAPSAKMDSNGNYYLTQPGSTSELQCVVPNATAADYSQRLTGGPACDYALAATTAAAEIVIGFFVPLKFVIITTEQVLIYFAAYVYSFIINNVANSIFTVCD